MSTDAKLTALALAASFAAVPVVIWAELAWTRRRNRKAAAHRAAGRGRLMSEV